jgi:soluble lytic murein transglycosylase
MGCRAATARERFFPRAVRIAAPTLLAVTVCLTLLPAQEAPPARLSAAAGALERGDPATALRTASGLARDLPVLADYAEFFRLQAAVQLKNHPVAVEAAQRVLAFQPLSPLGGRAAVYGAGALIESGRPGEALALLKRVEERRLPQPEAAAVRARALEAAGRGEEAAAAWQTVFFEHPLSNEAAGAAAALERLQSALGGRFPPVPPRLRFRRAELLAGGRRHADARAELMALAGSVTDRERELALVRAAAVRYAEFKERAALEELRGIACADPEAEAERLHWMALCLRREERPREMVETVERLARAAPASRWRLRALVAAGNYFLLEDARAAYTPLFEACAAGFPESGEAAYCHWKVAWRAWIERRPDATALLAGHLQHHPGSEKAPAALYYLARGAEARADAGAARRYYTELAERFPNGFYAALARERLEKAPPATAAGAPAVEKLLASIQWPAAIREPDFQPSAATRRRFERSRLLAAAGLTAWAYGELRFAANQDADPWPVAVELAETATRAGSVAQGIRWIKAITPAYLGLPRTPATGRLWRLAFPFPHRALIEKHARANGLDPFLVAGLIRQESEFDPQVVSSARAVGLMQVMPSTGREIARRLKIRFRPAMLKQVEPNLRLGAHYLRRLLDASGGSVEEALAAYNGGRSRVLRWKQWGDFREPAEFVETIPISETRNYVHIVQRNAEIYRWLYAAPVRETPAKKPGTRPGPASKPRTR